MAKCEDGQHVYPDEPDRETMSEEYFDCMVPECNYTYRRRK